jgi:hypothetical protein
LPSARKTQITQIIYLGLAAVFILGSADIGLVAAAELKTKEVKAEEKEEKIATVKKEITGVVSGISNNFIAIEYKVDLKEGMAYEIALNIGKDIKIERKKNLSEISMGDVVTVTYEENLKKEKDKDSGREKIRVMSRVAKVIKFVNKAKPVIENAETLESKELEEGQ